MRLGALLLLAGCGRIGFETPTDDGLVAYYPLDHIGANGTDDALGGPPAVCTPSCPTVVAGHVGRAMSFDGSQQRLQVASSPALSTTSGFTVGAWFIWDGSATTAYACVATKTVGPDEQNSWTICMQPQQTVFFGTSQNNSVVMLSSTGTLSTDAWHHVAVAWNGTTKTIWLDGVLDTSVAGPTEFDLMPMSIGGDYDNAGSPSYFTGTIDEVRIYDRVLAPREIAELAR